METLSLAQYVMINWTYGESLGNTVMGQCLISIYYFV